MDGRSVCVGWMPVAKKSIALMMAFLLVGFTVLTMPPEQAVAKAPSITVANANTGKVALKTGSSYALGAKAPGAKLTYKSSKEKIVTVSKKGKLKAVKAGKATITITAKKGSAKSTKKVKVTVLAVKKYKAVKSITAKTGAATLKPGGTTTITTTFKPTKASNKNLLYKSSNTKVATVSASGKVTAKAAGTVKITVTSCANKKAKAAVTVKVKKPASTPTPKPDPQPADVKVTSVELSETAMEFEEGMSRQLFAEVGPSDATDQTITWSTSDKSIADVDADGWVYAQGPGLAVVTATAASGVSADCEVHVNMAGAAEYDQFVQECSAMINDYGWDQDLAEIPEDPYYSGRLIVKDVAGLVDFGNLNPQPVASVNDGDGYTILQFASAEDAQSAAEAIETQLGDSGWVEPDVYMDIEGKGEEFLSVQEDYPHLSWGISALNMDDLASSLSGKKGEVLVAVVDSGVSAKHPILMDKVISGGYDHALGSKNTEDCASNSHGTHVAGIIADGTRALPQIKILPEKVKAGIIWPSWVANGVKHAVKHGAKIINISICQRRYDWNTGLIEYKTVSDAVEYAVNNGVTVVVAAGNDAKDTADRTPAHCEDAIVVGAVNKASERWVVSNAEASNTGSAVDLSAPGVEIESCAKDGGTIELTGTSMAAPHIAAAAAMIKLQHPEYSPAEIEQTLKDCASLPDGSSGRNDEYGYGIPDLILIAGNGDDSSILHDGVTGTCLWTLSENGTLTLSPASGDVGEIPEFDGDADDLGEEELRVWPWTKYSSQITSVRVTETVKLSGNCSGMFCYWRGLKTCDLSGLDVSSYVYDMSDWFRSCAKLETVYMPELEERDCGLEFASSMFNGCTSLKTVEFSGFHIGSSLETTQSMFKGCKSLKTLDLSTFVGTHNLRATQEMFSGCESLEVLDLSGLDTQGFDVIDCENMFGGCYALRQITVGPDYCWEEVPHDSEDGDLGSALWEETTTSEMLTWAEHMREVRSDARTYEWVG